MILGRKYVSDNKGACMAVARHDAPRSCCGNLHPRLRDLERITGYTEVGGHSDLSFRFADHSDIDKGVYQPLKRFSER